MADEKFADLFRNLSDKLNNLGLADLVPTFAMRTKVTVMQQGELTEEFPLCEPPSQRMYPRLPAPDDSKPGAMQIWYPTFLRTNNRPPVTSQ